MILHPAAALAVLNSNTSGKSGESADIYADNVSLLVPMQNSKVEDISRSGKRLFRFGNNLTFSGTGGPFGDGCAVFGTDTFMLVPTNMFVAATNFTIEFWVKTTAAQWGGIAGFECLPCNNSSGVNSMFTLYGQQMSSSLNGGSWIAALNTQFTTLNNGQWHHVCFERSGNTLTLFIDGAVTLQTTISGAFTTVGGYSVLGKKPDALTSTDSCSLAHLRITEGVARYGGVAFVRPSLAFQTVARGIAEVVALPRRVVLANGNPTLQTFRRYTVLG